MYVDTIHVTFAFYDKGSHRQDQSFFITVNTFNNTPFIFDLREQ